MDISKEEAYEILKDKKPGTFLLRFSGRQNNFVISRVVEKDEKPWVTHMIVRHSAKGFHIHGTSETYPDLRDLIKANKSVFKKKQPIEHVSPTSWLKQVAFRGQYEDEMQNV